MNGIIVVFPKIEDGKSVRNLLVRHGYEVTAICTQGAQVLNYIDTMNDGIIRECAGNAWIMKLSALPCP